MFDGPGQRPGVDWWFVCALHALVSVHVPGTSSKAHAPAPVLPLLPLLLLDDEDDELLELLLLDDDDDALEPLLLELDDDALDELPVAPTPLVVEPELLLDVAVPPHPAIARARSAIATFIGARASRAPSSSPRASLLASTRAARSASSAPCAGSSPRATAR